MRFWTSLLLIVCAVGCGESTPRPNVILITLDTTRRDHLGCYGYERDTSPNLDRLAADSILLENAISSSTFCALRREIRPDAGLLPVEDRIFRRNAVQAKQIRARSRWLMNNPG